MDARNKKRTSIIVLVGVALAAMLAISACVMPSSPTDPDIDPVEQAMQTLQAQATQDYYATLVSQLTPQPTEVLPSITPEVNPTNINQIPVVTNEAPTEVPTSTSTAVPTVVVTAIPPTATPIPPTPTPRPCYQVKFVSDVTVPDWTKITAGSAFTKTWRLQNSGTCNWDLGFDIIFAGGNQLGADKVYDLPKAVAPGETIDISIPMVAPQMMGNYTSEWMLMNNYGLIFGTGSDSKGPFWAKIQSVDGKGVVYSFAEKACDARWSTSQESKLSCPGKETSVDDGYVLTKQKPVREGGGIENEIGLITRPDDSEDGYIQGIYPAFLIKDGDLFKAAIQCEGGSTGCKIKFELYYRVEGGKFVELGEWKEKYDDKWTKVEVDLSSLAGKKVEFSLVVWNDGSSVDNRGLWLNPIIYRTK